MKIGSTVGKFLSDKQHTIADPSKLTKGTRSFKNAKPKSQEGFSGTYLQEFFNQGIQISA